MDVEKPEIPIGFGLPAEDDPDPFGVKALEKEGMAIRDANTKTRPSLDAFEYKPSPSSPIYSTFRRHSVDSARRDSKRSSVRSVASIDRGTQTQTDDPPSTSPIRFDEVALGNNHASEDTVQEPEDQEAAPIVTKARLVSIPKRIPPRLPPRNPNRSSPTTPEPPATPPGRIDQGAHAHVPSPLKDSSEQFQDININDEHFTEERDLKEGMPHVNLSSLASGSLEPPKVTGDDASVNTSQNKFDELSTSESDHSKETGSNSNGTSITLQDNEIDGGTSKQNEDKTTDMSEEFHSMPSTPIETSTPGLHGGKDRTNAFT